MIDLTVMIKWISVFLDCWSNKSRMFKMSAGSSDHVVVSVVNISRKMQ